ncbi:MAG: hypothetical protein LAN59_09100 [Acidobacteriia bacterium]|nr:hypothetical protein [Terriglobia bacterium]
MRGLGQVVGLLVVVLITGLVYKFYFAQGSNSAAVAHPVQTINTVGVKSDLLSIAQAERTYQAEHGSYASFDELVSGGAITLRKSGRDGYTYDVATSAEGFQVTARCPAATSPGCTNYVIDQTMEVQTAP